MSDLLSLSNGRNLRVDCIASGIFRIRMGDGDCLHESGLNRYGILHDEPDASAAETKLSETADGWLITTSECSLRITAEDGCVSLEEPDGNVLLQSNPAETAPDKDGFGFKAGFNLHKDDKLYGLGHVDCNVDSGTESLQRRGRFYSMIQTSQLSYAPISFMMSPRGWALFMNTTWFHSIDAGAENPDLLSFNTDGGELDYYLIAGEYPKALLNHYTTITGRPLVLPEWGYGFMYDISQYETLSNADMALDTAIRMRDRDIPCDTIKITDWMDNENGSFYNFSLDKDWSPKRYKIMPWRRVGGHTRHAAPNTEENFLGLLKSMGYRVALWLCCGYDLTEYEELQLIAKLPPEEAARERKRLGLIDPEAKKLSEGGLNALNIVDPRLRAPVYSDTYTKLGEPWFEHLKKFVDDGVRVFMQDGSHIGLKHPDRKWKNGMDDAEVHNFHCVIYAKQMQQGFTEYTEGKRAMVFMARTYAGSQQYLANWAGGDNGGGPNAMNCLMNYSFCGISNTCTDMERHSAGGVHFAFFQGWTSSNMSQGKPWHRGKRQEGLIRYYSKLRHRLLPYIYSIAHVANRTGYPLARPMPMEYPNDPKSDELLCQYMFGDAFLVSAFVEEVHLPVGQWINYWTGEQVEGPVTVPADYPEDRGGPLFVRAGSIIPMAPDMDYWGEKPLDVVTLDIYPGNREEPSVLYEDDGDTEAYRDGKVATTTFDQKLEDNGQLTITVSPREGDYDGMPENRRYRFKIHCQEPADVLLNGSGVSDWEYDAERSTLDVGPVAQEKDGNIVLNITT